MKPTRRKTVLGLGAMATGSGAVFSSAAFTNSAQADADFRVRVSEDLQVEAGNAFNDDGSVAASSPNDEKFIDPEDSGDSGTGDNFYESNDLGSVFESGGQDRSPPLATVSARDENAVSGPAYAGVNDDLAIFVALDEGDGTTSFSGLLQVTNNTNQDQNVGIAYDGTSSPSQYGSDAENSNVTTEDVQEAYQFKQGSTLISPDPTETGGGATDNTTTGWDGDAEDAPANTVTVSSASTVQIELETDVDKITDLAAQAGLSPGFGEASKAVDLLDGITVVAEPQ